MDVPRRQFNILIATGIFPPDIGGPASYARTLLQGLGEGFHASVLTYAPLRRAEARDTGSPRIVRVWRVWPKGIRHVLYAIKAILLARHHDVVFTLNAVSAGVPAMWAARMAGKPLFVHIPGDYAWETAIQRGATLLLMNDFQKEPHRGWIGMLHRIQVAVCTHAHGVIVPSEYLADIVRGWGISPEKIHVIHNGVPHQQFPSREEARKAIGVSGNLLVSIGRLVPWKGFRMLIKIMPQLLSINQFFRLVIAGDGPDLPALRSMVRNLGLERKVVFLGSQSPAQVRNVLAAADIFILNTGYEGFSHQILEAMSAGIPVVTTAVGGNREVVRQGENGFLVKYNDEFNLVEAVKTLWRMPELRQEFAERGQDTAGRFTSVSMVEKTLTLLQSHG